jgi:hypothetical protein
VEKMDDETIFLHGELKEGIFMEKLEGFVVGSENVIYLKYITFIIIMK